jgi:hypothetical protein
MTTHTRTRLDSCEGSFSRLADRGSARAGLPVVPDTGALRTVGIGNTTRDASELVNSATRARPLAYDFLEITEIVKFRLLPFHRTASKFRFIFLLRHGHQRGFGSAESPIR